MLGWALLVGAFLFGGTGDTHVLNVPYRNQLDGSPYALANCGPTALSMAFAYYGIDASPWDLRVRSMKVQHSWVTDEGGYSDWPALLSNSACMPMGSGTAMAVAPTSFTSGRRASCAASSTPIIQ